MASLQKFKQELVFSISTANGEINEKQEHFLIESQL
jgi:hypothetical protein